jgi:dipeptidase
VGIKRGQGLILSFLFSWLAIIGLIFSAPASSKDWANWEEELSCTSIMAGRLATVDGSVITAHSCDGNYRNWLNLVPRKKNPAGATTKIYSGLMHTETPWDTRNVSLRGEIPEVEETLAYLNTAYPCLNEYQLAIGETTIGGRRQLYNPEACSLSRNWKESCCSVAGRPARQSSWLAS